MTAQAAQHYTQLAGDLRRDLLRKRLDQANVAADEAIATYETRQAQLRNAWRDGSGLRVAQRDDHPLQDAAGAVAYQTGLANRLAATLTVELLTELLRRQGG